MRYTAKDLVHIVKNNKVTFSSYRKGNLYYKIIVNDLPYRFPVPTEDTQDGTFLAEDKAILFTRYIRKALENSTFEHLA